LDQYGPQVVNRLNFARGRILPLLALNSSMSFEVSGGDRLQMTIHADGENLNNRLNVLDFGGLFSGNAIAHRSALCFCGGILVSKAVLTNLKDSELTWFQQM
jgi:hypothetical protein